MSISYEYCMLNNIPITFHSSDLRNFFAVFTEADKFDLFHFRHRPQTLSKPPIKDSEPSVSTSKLPADGERNTDKILETDSKTENSIKKFCCLIRFADEKTLLEFIKKYHQKHWIDKKGNELPSRVFISQIDLKPVDLVKFASKELGPPSLMPKGNIGTPNGHFLNLIKECRLPPSLIKKLGLEFPRGRVFRTYSNVPFDYGNTENRRRRREPTNNVRTSLILNVSAEKPEDEEEIRTGKGHLISSSQKPEETTRDSESMDKEESDNESNADDDDDRCEEWERHEALRDNRTTHGTMVDEDKERLYEEKIELKWEKGGSGLVFYTDAQFWESQRGDFDEQTADDWDVDMEGYYVPGGGDQDAKDYMEMRRSERFQQGLEDVTVFAPKKSKPSMPRPPSPPGPSSSSQTGKIGAFEKFTRGIGRKILEKNGWKDGQGLGTTIIGMSDALENEGHGPTDRRGFGYHGEKLEFTSKESKKRRKDFNSYSIEAENRIIIGTIYDTPTQLDVEEPSLRRNAPTYIKRYNFMKGSKK